MPDTAGEEENRAYTDSCCIEGVEYRLYDIVKVYDRKYRVPHIAKILKMWEERSSGARKALVCWFFWHKEVKPTLAENPKELFIASGNGIGVTNELHMDSIIGKCKVVCTSSDPRNKEPSHSVLESADFVFSQAYDVDLKITVPVEVVADKVGPDVVFNTHEWFITISKIKEETDGSQALPKSSLAESKKRPRDTEASTLSKQKFDQQEKSRVNAEGVAKKKKTKVLDGKAPVPKRESIIQKEEEGLSKRQFFKAQILSRLHKTSNKDVKEPAAAGSSDLDKVSRKRSLDKLDSFDQRESKKATAEVSHERLEDEDNQRLDSKANTPTEGREQADSSREADSEPEMLDMEKAVKKEREIASKESLFSDMLAGKRLTAANKTFEKIRIFRQLPWDENLRRGIPLGKVLHLQNIDPSFTSADMIEMLNNTFEGLSDARVLPKETICPSGQAVAIFETQQSADSALEAMERDCFVIADRKWPVIASKVKEPVNQTMFPGHLMLEKLKPSRNTLSEEFRKAVSTSHCSQPNTIEFEMAMEWRHLQEITQNCRTELFKKQRKDLNDFRSRLSNKAKKTKQERGVG